MNTVKSNYIAAKLEYQRACLSKENDLKPHENLLDTDEGIEQYVDLEMDAAKRHNVRNKEIAMDEAKVELFKWAASVVRKDKAYKPVADTVEPLLEILTGQRKPKAYEMSAIVGKGHDQLVDIALRLAE